VRGRGGLPYVLPFESMIQVEPTLINPKSSNVLKPSSPQSSKIGMQLDAREWGGHTIEQMTLNDKKVASA
jgi:hypothetical protein